MPGNARAWTLLSFALALCVVLAPRPAHAWLDLRVVSDVATVEVGADGRARVHHDLMLRVRGGPLHRFSVQGIDRDAGTISDAQMVLAKSGRAAGVPIALLAARELDLLTLDLSYQKGVRTGTYLVQFAYETDLKSRGLLQPGGLGTVLTWRGPRFDDGINSLKARFSFPRSEPPPAPWSAEQEELTPSGANLLATDDGVFLAELRREADHDVLELTRPHAAKGEQVTWTVSYAAPAAPNAATKPAAVAPERPPPVVAPDRSRRALHWLGGLAAGLLFGTLVLLKHGWLSTRRRTKERSAAFVVPMPRWVRFAMIASGLGIATGVALDIEHPTWAALAAVVVFAVSLQQALPERPCARGPGTWQSTSHDHTPDEVRSPWSLGGLLEGSTPWGGLLFSLLLGVGAIFALRAIGNAPYHSAAIVGATALWVPLFFTLGGARLALGRLELEWFALEPWFALFRRRGLPVEMMARRATQAGATAVDEHRVRFEPRRACAGFDSLELAVECHHRGWFVALEPVFIARVREGSRAHLNLPRGAQWSRGRHRDERIALIRPKATSASACLAVASELLRRLASPVLEGEGKGKPAERAQPPSQPRAKARTSSSGSAESTAKAARFDLPG